MVSVLAWLLRTLAFGVFDESAGQAHALIVGLVATGAQYVAEIPNLAIQWATSFACCKCCIARDDDFGVV